MLRDLLNKRSGLEYLETLLRYVASGSDQIREEEIERGIKEILKEKGGDIMPTVAEQWIERGIILGMGLNRFLRKCWRSFRMAGFCG